MSEYDELITALRDCAEVNSLSRYKRDLMRQAAGAIKKLQAHIDGWIEWERKALLKSVPKWIPVTEQLPEEDTDVLVVRKFLGVKGQVPPSTYVEIASRIGDDWSAVSDEYKIARSKHTDPLYWMPLPEPPKEDK